MREERTEVAAPELVRWLPVGVGVVAGLLLYIWVLLAAAGAAPDRLVGR